MKNDKESKGSLEKTIEKLEKQLHVEQQKNLFSNAILESGNLIIWSVDLQFELLSFNQNYFQYLLPSIDNNKIYYESNGVLKSANQQVFWKRNYKKTLKGESINFEIKINVGSHKEWKEVFLNPVFGKDAKIHAISGVAYDITDKTVSRKKLIQSEEKFRNIFESFQDLYFRTDFKGNIILLSPSVKEIMGYEESELIGENATNYYLYNVKIKSLLRELIRFSSIRNFETRVVHKSGKVIPIMCNIRIITAYGKPQYIEGVARDITELKRTHEQLQHSKELAEKSLKIKERFLANMSHEIKTPLNGIVGMLHLLEKSELNTQQKKHVKALTSSSEILMNVLNDLLDLSKIEAGKMELKNSIVETETIFDNLKNLYELEASKNNISLTFNISNEVPENILADRIKLIQIFSNFISNAIKFTPNGGKIDINLSLKKKKKNSALKLRGSVSDTGIGISLEGSKRLFKSFTQLDSSSRKTYKGTGLGLYISKKLALMMNGKIGFQPNENQGSTFWFTFDTIGISPSGSVENNNILKFNLNIKLLVVDDNRVNLQLASEILKKAGCHVVTANSGARAVKLSEEQSFDVILMDIQMPNMDGIEASLLIKETPMNKTTPIIAMTAYSMEGDKSKYLGAGMDDYISKPVNPELLLLVIEKWTENKIVQQNTTGIQENISEMQTINLSTLDKLIAYGDKEMVKEALMEFDLECDKQIIDCNSLYPKENFDEILNILHTIKGNAGTLGIEKMACLAGYIEDEVKKKNYHIFEKSMIQFKELHNNLKKAIKHI